MKFMNDWVALALAFGLVCGGSVIGRRIGSFAALWLAGAAWLALRMADAVWEPATAGLIKATANMDAASAPPAAYALLFAGTLLPAVLLLLVLRPAESVELPARIEPGVAALAGMAGGALVLAAVLQSHVQAPELHEAMPRAMAWTKSALEALGQTHTAPSPPQSPPASAEASE